MVDALREAWRVLRGEGTLIDLRPLSTSISDIEAVDRDGAATIGTVSAQGAKADDEAASAAVATLVGEGRFVPVMRSSLELDFFWNTFDELMEFVATSRRFEAMEPAPPEVARRFRERLRQGPARLRCTRPLLLDTYRKPE